MEVVIVKDKNNPMRKPFPVNKETADNTPHYEVLSTEVKPVVKKKEREVAAVEQKEVPTKSTHGLLEDKEVFYSESNVEYTDGAFKLISDNSLDIDTVDGYFKDNSKKVTKRDVQQYLKRK